MGIKDFIVSQALKRQLKKLPESQRAVVEKLITKNPKLFETIAKEIQEKKKNGMDETLASMMVMRKYQSEFQKMAKEM